MNSIEVDPQTWIADRFESKDLEDDQVALIFPMFSLYIVLQLAEVVIWWEQRQLWSSWLLKLELTLVKDGDRKTFLEEFKELNRQIFGIAGQILGILGK